MALEHAILGFLDGEPMTGYDLKTRCFDSAAGHLWPADQAQVYRTLERLGRSGLVKPRIVPQRGRPDRKVYAITARGRKELAAWLRSPEEPATLRDPFLMHLFFAKDLADDEVLSLLRNARGVYQGRLDNLRVRAAHTLGAPVDHAETAREAELRGMTVTAGISSLRSAVDWIDDCIDRVRTGLPPAPGLAGPPDADPVARPLDGGHG